MPARLLLVTLALLLGACFQDSTPKHSNFLPLDYPANFQPVRDCRLNVAHDNNYMKVLANAVAADPYTSASYPLPASSVLVAEEHGSDPSCSSPSGYYVMAKEQPGYNPDGADWHWQRLDINQRIEQDGKLQACISCHAQCSATDFLCSRL